MVTRKNKTTDAGAAAEMRKRTTDKGALTEAVADGKKATGREDSTAAAGRKDLPDGSRDGSAEDSASPDHQIALRSDTEESLKTGADDTAGATGKHAALCIDGKPSQIAPVPRSDFVLLADAETGVPTVVDE